MGTVPLTTLSNLLLRDTGVVDQQIFRKTSQLSWEIWLEIYNLENIQHVKLHTVTSETMNQNTYIVSGIKLVLITKSG
jgi:hypothetical protein